LKRGVNFSAGCENMMCVFKRERRQDVGENGVGAGSFLSCGHWASLGSPDPFCRTITFERTAWASQHLCFLPEFGSGW
jgi:hypothetical protein